MQKKYASQEVEKKWQEKWKEDKLYSFNIAAEGPIYSFDTPPPFTSGTLHMGHIYNHVWIDLDTGRPTPVPGTVLEALGLPG